MVLKSASEFLTLATREKENARLDEAIDNLRKAYKRAEKEKDTEFGIDTYLRLPLYLQRAGRNDEAWSEFNLLLSARTEYKIPYTLDAGCFGKIYDKMRLFLQREKKFDEAIAVGIQAYLFQAISLYELQQQSVRMDAEQRERMREYFDEEYEDDRFIAGQQERLDDFLSKDGISRNLGILFRKAKKMNRKDVVVDFISSMMEHFPNIKPNEITTEIERLL